MLLKSISFLLVSLMLVLAGIVACNVSTVNVPLTKTPVVTTQEGLATRAANDPGIGLQTRAHPTNPNAASSNPTATRPAATRTPSASVNGFQSIAYDTLPPEAKATLALIRSDGPFPYRQDGQIFQNREWLLPKKQNGYYHEYTVETPGSDDRGARRIITGGNGELYYTSDHYRSFKVILTNE